MQIGNLDSHNRASHQVTNCICSHTETKNETGGPFKASASSQAVQKELQSAEQLTVQMSPEGWLRKILSKGRELALHMWGEGQTEGTKSDTLQAKEGVLEESRGTGRRTGIDQHKGWEQQKTIEEMSSYFVMPEKKQAPPGLLRRFRIKVHTATGYLEKHLPFKQTGSFQAKQEKKEDLRKHSRYRRDEMEIDCILTDDSYLMDSYDRKGEYSKLSTENRK